MRKQQDWRLEHLCESLALKEGKAWGNRGDSQSPGQDLFQPGRSSKACKESGHGRGAEHGAAGASGRLLGRCVRAEAGYSRANEAACARQRSCPGWDCGVGIAY